MFFETLVSEHITKDCLVLQAWLCLQFTELSQNFQRFHSKYIFEHLTSFPWFIRGLSIQNCGRFLVRKACGLRFDNTDDDNYEGIVKSIDNVTFCVLLICKSCFDTLEGHESTVLAISFDKTGDRMGWYHWGFC